MDANVGLSGGGECAHASTASPPCTLYPIEAARAKNIRCTGCSTHEEHVDAVPFNAGADLGDPSKFDWYEKGSRADNGGFVSAEMTARKRSFFTILFAQHTHDANGIRARKRKAKRCIWARNLSFGLLYYASWV